MSIVDARGREVRRATIEHNAAGLRELLELLSRAGAREVAIERPDGPVVDTLLEAGITVVVISPNQLKNLRGRYGSAGNKDDRFDAFVLADTLRTDRSRLRPLLPDTPARPRPSRPPQPAGPRSGTGTSTWTHWPSMSPSISATSPTTDARVGDAGDQEGVDLG